MNPKFQLSQILFPCFLFLLLSQATSGQDYWPQFRGPNGSGLAAEDATPPTIFDKTTLLWKTKLPKGHSSPCIWGNNIFVTAHIKDNSELQTICINRSSGKIKWAKSIFPKSIEKYHLIGNAAQASPTNDGARVYIYFGSFGILCYSHEGELIWKYKIDIPEYHDYFYGVASSPIIYVVNDHTIFVGAWQIPGGVQLRSDLLQYADFSVLCDQFDANHDSLIQKKELPDTLFLFKRPETHNADNTAHEPLKWFYALGDKDKNESINKTEWNQFINLLIKFFYKKSGLIAINPIDSGELAIENIAWRELEKVPEVPSPIYCNDNIYMCKNGGILTAMDAKSGKIHYRERIGAAGPYMASPVAANANIYIPSGNGKITVIKGGNTLKIVAQNDLDEKIYATPAIIGNIFYVRTNNYLYAYGN